MRKKRKHKPTGKRLWVCDRAEEILNERGALTMQQLAAELRSEGIDITAQELSMVYPIGGGGRGRS